LGGDERAAYRALLRSVTEWTTVNLDTKTQPTIFHDLEKPLPVADGVYDGALLMNVLEHVYNHRQLVAEAVRVTKTGGTIVVVVPFLFPVHPSPDDFWRFTDRSLRRLFLESGCADVTVTPLGSGVFSARFLMIERLLPGPLRTVCDLLSPLVVIADSLWTELARLLRKKYTPSDYALGYCVTGVKI
jgi:SAM-dependent methyltransferase